MERRDTFGSPSQRIQLSSQLDLAKKPPATQPIGEPVQPKFKGRTAVLIATGPSFSGQQLETIQQAKKRGDVVTFGINNIYQQVPDLDVLLSCDGPWWRWYWNDPVLREMSKTTEMWTWYPEFAKEFGINYIYGDQKMRGLSLDPCKVHINHGSGPMILNLAILYGCSKIVMIGHDMKFAPDYKPREQKPGSTPRHYFGEYPKPLQHWPSVKVRQGVLDGLIEAYREIKEDMDARLSSVDVVNCTPDTALKMFRRGDLEKEI